MRRMTDQEVDMLAVLCTVLRRSLEDLGDDDAAQLAHVVPAPEEGWYTARLEILALHAELEDVLHTKAPWEDRS